MRRKLEDRYNIELIGEIMHITQGNEHFSMDFFDKKGRVWKPRLHYHDFYELEFGEEISVCTVRFTSVMLDRNIVSALADSSVSRRTISERSSAIA